MTTIRWSVGTSLILLAVALGASTLADTKSVVGPEEGLTSVSVQKLEQQKPLVRLDFSNFFQLLEELKGKAENQSSPRVFAQGLGGQDPLVEPAFRKAVEASRKKETAELALPSGLPTSLPQIDPNLADGVDIHEEADFLVGFYAAMYDVDPRRLRHIVRCESTDNPEETGDLGERGSAQFLRSTWETTPQARYGWDAAYHPAVNIEAAAWLLSESEVGGKDHWFWCISQFQ